MDVLPTVELPAAPSGSLQQFVDWLRGKVFAGAMDRSTACWFAFLLIRLAAVLARRLMIRIVSSQSKRLPEKPAGELLLPALEGPTATLVIDRKSTRLNSSHLGIS